MASKVSAVRSKAQKVAIFRSCFSGMTHVYGSYDPDTGRVFQVKRPVTDSVILAHLQGQRPYGVYLLVGDRTRAISTDFDDNDVDSPLRFIHRAAELGITAELERSKSKGYHCWIFAEAGGVSAAKARYVVKVILNNIGMAKTEIFPKQDRLGPRKYGNFINAPLFGRLVPDGRSVFLNPGDSLRPHADQWSLLANVNRLSKERLDEVLRSVSLPSSSSFCSPGQMPGTSDPPAAGAPMSPRPANHNSFGLTPCARRMLAGVNSYQRVTCFRLAVHLKRLGIPQDLALVMLKAWAGKNRPGDRQVITPEEVVSQIQDAYRKDYRSYGCEDPMIRAYCDPSCPVQRGPVVAAAGCVAGQKGRDRIGQEQKPS